ncbi:MAG: gluconate 2-dehydrogenase subunit 3 family protein [Saprospiraceae bacterium]|nr:gluconate 2-dehydrogenase subunit 3 family protein [Saprospiraceae bacterium]
MKRRAVLSRSGWILGSAVFGTGLISAIEGCQSKVKREEEWTLDNDQLELVKALADTIIPKTDTPSASDVGVPRYIDLLLHDVFEPDAVREFEEGLATLSAACQAQAGKPFLLLSQQQQHDFLLSIEKDIYAVDAEREMPFYLTFKKLCVAIYFTTEQGIKQNLVYNPIPGGYQGDVPLESGDRIEVGNEM